VSTLIWPYILLWTIQELPFFFGGGRLNIAKIQNSTQYSMLSETMDSQWDDSLVCLGKLRLICGCMFIFHWRWIIHYSSNIKNDVFHICLNESLWCEWKMLDRNMRQIVMPFFFSKRAQYNVNYCDVPDCDTLFLFSNFNKLCHTLCASYVVDRTIMMWAVFLILSYVSCACACYLWLLVRAFGKSKSPTPRVRTISRNQR